MKPKPQQETQPKEKKPHEKNKPRFFAGSENHTPNSNTKAEALDLTVIGVGLGSQSK